MRSRSGSLDSLHQRRGMDVCFFDECPNMATDYFRCDSEDCPFPGKRFVCEDHYRCPECHNEIPADAKFCLYCGHQQLVIRQCTSCGKNLTANAKFCSRCGHAAEEKPLPRHCTRCGVENLPDSKFCGSCGEKIETP